MGAEDEDELDGLVIEGAGEFDGRPDGKIHGRGMLGLISAIPPAPKLPNIRGVRMLAPTIPSERPGGYRAPKKKKKAKRPDWAAEDAAPQGLPTDALASVRAIRDGLDGDTEPVPPPSAPPADVAGEPEHEPLQRAKRAMRTTGETLVQPVHSRQAYMALGVIAALVVIAVAAFALPL